MRLNVIKNISQFSQYWYLSHNLVENPCINYSIIQFGIWSFIVKKIENYIIKNTRAPAAVLAIRKIMMSYHSMVTVIGMWDIWQVSVVD